MHVRWTSLGRQEAALTSVCWETATKPEPAAVALGSAWAAMASPAKVSGMASGIKQLLHLRKGLSCWLEIV